MPDYELLISQMEALAEISADPVPVLANASALLYEALPDINWAGFYLVKYGCLLLGPFQGRPACVRIEKGRGVCGTAWERDEVQLVADVHSFPGHIACDAASNSEIVVPLHGNRTERYSSAPGPAAEEDDKTGKALEPQRTAGGKIVGVLDIDSPVPARFTEEDRDGLVRFAAALERTIDWT